MTLEVILALLKIKLVLDTRSENTVLVNSGFEDGMEKKLENILSKISGVRKS